MRVTIHQPEFAPWLGFFHKVGIADKLILLDDVQFRKNYFQNRNRVRLKTGETWITVPVQHTGLETRINEVLIARESTPEWTRRMCKTLEQAYGKAPGFQTAMDSFREILFRAGTRLADLNSRLLGWMLEQFELYPQVCLSSQWGLTSTGSQRILELCKTAGADCYISGISGRDYLDLRSFQEAGIEVQFQEFHHPVYPQCHPGFLPQMSALEPIMLMGANCPPLLTPEWAEHLETVFA